MMLNYLKLCSQTFVLVFLCCIVRKNFVIAGKFEFVCVCNMWMPVYESNDIIHLLLSLSLLLSF